ncbi:hypothetical protein BDQ17DRAFT_1546316 [Cyathus striatus]|nr:hypothetical protein BDQ17DRAFT_1546316 [Cyathus striatus]
MGQISLAKASLISTYFEGLVYGLFLSLFGVTLYLYLNPIYKNQRQDNHTLVMTGISAIMFFIATFHLAINFYRLLDGYVDKGLTPFEISEYLGNLRAWHYILKDILMGIQQHLGSAAAIYRTWVLWNYNWKVVAFPIVLLTFNIIVSAVISAAMATNVGSIFSVTVFYRVVQAYNAVAFTLSVITVGLMSYRIWTTHRKVAHSLVGQGKLLSVMWFLIESAALQIITEFILFVTTFAFDNAQFIVLELITPLVGITFNSITVRIKLQSLKEAGTQTQDANNPVHTIGGVPLRHIKINITKEVENDVGDSKRTPESSTY